MGFLEKILLIIINIFNGNNSLRHKNMHVQIHLLTHINNHMFTMN